MYINSIKHITRKYLNERINLNENHYIGYHGSDDHIYGDFKNLNPNIYGFFFSDNYENAKTYGDIVGKYRLTINNPLIIDATGLKFTNDIPIEVIFDYPTWVTGNPDQKPYMGIIELPLDDIVDMVKNGKKQNKFIDIKDREKYDGVIFKNIIDPLTSSRGNIQQDTIVVFDNSQIEEI